MMAAIVSKRQQARNEKILQDLVQSVPGNNACADCQARNPAWASWSLGIFLCMRCAAIHRKLGTHISKVKSLSMDSWTNEQVDNMKKMGNARSEQTRNSQNKQPNVSADPDEADIAMERFIRQRYAPASSTTAGREPGYPSSDSDGDSPPPLPPKSPPQMLRANTRSASIFFSRSTRTKREAALRANDSRTSAPRLVNKPSKVFGATVSYDPVRGSRCPEDDTDVKLAKLRDIGFNDEQLNTVMLRGVGGSLERAVEGLIRLGSRARTPASAPASLLTSPLGSSLHATRSITPVGVAPVSALVQADSEGFLSSPTSSTNIFDAPALQPQSSQSTGTIQANSPYPHMDRGHVLAIHHQADTVSRALSNLNLAGPQLYQPQLLFPHHTGGLPIQNFNPPQSYPQQMTTPVAPRSHPFSYGSAVIPPAQALPLQAPPFRQQQWQQPLPPLQQQEAAKNPFYAQHAMQQSHSPTLRVNTTAAINAASSVYGNNPFTRSPTRIQSPSLGQIPEQSQPAYYASAPFSMQPFAASQCVTTQYVTTFPPTAVPSSMLAYQHMPQFASQKAHQQAYQQQKPDTAAIMALYNYPSRTPQLAAAAYLPPLAEVPRSASTPIPLAGSNNPFLPSSPATTSPASPTASMTPPTRRPGLSVVLSGDVRHRDSIALGKDMAWANGRQSPDAFASLSAKYAA